MPDYGKRTGRDAFESLERRLAAAERELRRQRGGGLSTIDRGDTLTQPAPVEGQTMIQYDTDTPWYYANGEWRDFCCEPSSGGPSLLATIEALPGLNAFWPLNESSGSVAHDASGNGHDLTSTLGQLPPTWAQPAGPPGEQSAGFSAVAQGLYGSWTTLAANFTVFGWVYLSDSGAHTVCGTGQTLEGGTTQWELWVNNADQKLNLSVDSDQIASTTAVPVGAWFMVALSRTATTWSLYIDGVEQATHSTVNPGGPNTGFWLAQDMFNIPFGFSFRGRMSYFGVVTGAALTTGDILGLYDTAATGGAEPAGLVLVSDGSGGTSWDYPVAVWVNGA